MKTWIMKIILHYNKLYMWLRFWTTRDWPGSILAHTEGGIMTVAAVLQELSSLGEENYKRCL